MKRFLSFSSLTCALSLLATPTRGVAPTEGVRAAPQPAALIDQVAPSVAVGDLRGQRIAVAWTPGASEYGEVFGEILAHASREVTPPLVLVDPSESEDAIRELVAARGGDPEHLELLPAALDTFWIRDFGPQVVETDEGFELVDFPYDVERPNDDGVPDVLAAHFGLAVRETPLDVEGGHLVVEAGVCITNDEVISRGNRDGWTATEVMQELEELFGCRRVVLVPALLGEPTGHVDLYVAATGPGRVVVGAYAVADDAENARRLDWAARQLADAGLQVTRVPMPPNDERTIFRSYTNLVILPGAVLVPSYPDAGAREDEAHAILRRELVGKALVPIDVSSLIQLEGALHCVALTLPF